MSASGHADPLVALRELSTEHFDPADPLRPSGRLRRRTLVSRIADAGQALCALIALGVLGVVVFSVIQHGAGVMSVGFLTKGPPRSAEQAGGGIAPEIVGTALLMAVATAIAMPAGVLVALYLTEHAGRGRVARLVSLALDLINGLPTIVIGLFIFGVFVVGNGQSGFAGSLALAMIMLPLIACGAQEVLLLVPQSTREAADALGVSRWRTLRGVVLPSALGGIVTATVLAVARAAGETAPLVLVSSVFGNTVSLQIFGQALPNIPVYIYSASEQASAYGFERAWGAALVLLAFIFLASLGGRGLLARSQARLGQ